MKTDRRCSHLEASRTPLCRVPGTVLIVFLLFTANLYPQSSNLDLTRHNGLIAKAFLKSCERLTTVAVDFDGDGAPYQVEWWRCGSRNPNWEKGRFPVHYVLIRPPKNKWQVTPFSLSNTGSSDEYFIDQLRLIDIPIGARQLLAISGTYYKSDQGTIQCVLERVADQFQCSASIDPHYASERLLRVHRSLLRELEIFLNSPP